MFALRRAAARAAFTQPVRQISTLRPAQSRVSTLQLEKPTLYRSFHQSLRWCAEEEKKEASPAEAEATDETVTTEPTAEEQKEIKEQSVASPEIVESAKETAEKAGEQVQEKAQEAASQAQDTASSAAEKAQELASSAAQTVQSAASNVAQAARPQFPARDSGAAVDSRTGRSQPSKILYVGNLFFEVTSGQLESEFGKFGEITNSRIVTDPRGMSKGFGYVEFASQDGADRAVRELDQKVFQGRRMAVQYHVRREPRTGGRQERRPNEPSKTLFIGNMSYQMSDRDLNDLFREIRNVLDVRVAIDRRSGQPRGFAHADFIDIQSAERAKEYLEKKVVYGRQLKIDFSQSSSASRTAE